MVNMCMREERGIDRLGIEGQVGIALKGFVAVTLIESAVEQDSLCPGLDEVHRAGRRSRSAVEG